MIGEYSSQPTVLHPYHPPCLPAGRHKGGRDERVAEESMNDKKFETYGNCFVCGENNAGGLRLRFDINKEKQILQTTFFPQPVYQGYDGVVHGGIISTLLDEAMAKLSYELGYDAVTASLEVRFKKPALILEPLKIFGEIAEVNQRLVRAKAKITKEDGTVLATGTSTLLRQHPGSRRPF